MEKSVKNAVFKGFPVLMESGPLGSKQYSQTTNEEKNNFLSSYFKVYYLVSKCTGKRVADRSAIDTALSRSRSTFSFVIIETRLFLMPDQMLPLNTSRTVI